MEDLPVSKRIEVYTDLKTVYDEFVMRMERDVRGLSLSLSCTQHARTLYDDLLRLTHLRYEGEKLIGSDTDHFQMEVEDDVCQE